MKTDDEKIDAVKKWLVTESATGNELAAAYSSLLTSANTEITSHYYLMLHDMLESFKKVAASFKDK